MQCECQLPCRDEPVNEADAFYSMAFLLVVASVSVFLIFAGHQVVLWLPLGAAATLFACFGRHYDAKRFRSQPVQNAVSPVLKSVNP